MNARTNSGDLVGQWCRSTSDGGSRYRIRAVAGALEPARFILLVEDEVGGALRCRETNNTVLCEAPIREVNAAAIEVDGAPYRGQP